MTALEVVGLTVQFGPKVLVEDVSLNVEPGEWLTVIGPNGAGKSTLLNAVAGLVPFRGELRFYGEQLAAMPRRSRARKVALVAQNPVVPPGMTVYDYVLLGRTPHIPVLGRESASDLAVVEDICERLELVELANRQLETLSGGERQRVFLARALAQLAGAERAVLLLDEPTTALDVGHQQDVMDLVDELRSDVGLSVMSTMHDLLIAGEYADRLLMLADGVRVAMGKPSQVLTAELLLQHYRATVEVVDTSSGPVAVPVRRERSTRSSDR